MPRPLFTTLLLLCGTVWAGRQARAQERPALIPFMAYEFGAPNGIERAPGVVNREEFATDGFGTSVNHTAALGLMLSIPELQGSPFGIIFRANVVQSDGRFTSDPYTGTAPAVSGTTGIRLPTQNRFTVRATESQGRMGLLGTWKGRPPFSLGIGPWIGYRFSSNVTQTEEILSPNDGMFTETESRRRTVAAGEEITAFAWRFGGAAELMGTVSLSSIFRIAPFIGLRFDAESLFDKGAGLRAFSVEAGLGFAVDLFPGGEEGRSDGPPLLPVPPAFPLSARIDLYDASSPVPSDTLRIATERIVHTRYLPVVPLLRFPAGETDPGAFYRLADREEAMGFAEERLFDRTPEEMEREGANIIARRLRDRPDEEVRLTGIVLPEESAELALLRCRNLIRYLAETWGIDSARIRIAGTERSGRMAGVRIAASGTYLQSPIVQRWEREEFIPPSLALRREIAAPAGLQRWRVELRQGDRMIGELRSDAEGSGSAEETLASLPFGDSATQFPLEAELTVTDHTGAQATARDRLTVTTAAQPRSRRSYVWRLLDPAHDTSLEIVNAAFIRLMAETADNNSRIVIEERGVEEEKGTRKFGRESVARELLERLAARGIVPASLHIERKGEEEKEKVDGTGRGAGVIVTLMSNEP